MSSDRAARDSLIDALFLELRKVSAYSVLLSQVIAERRGINPTDMECSDLLEIHGRMTAGRLAELTGLTTGAITGVVDRLEKAGFVRRERDGTDRRKVFIVPVAGRMMEIGRLYELVKRAMQRQCEDYSDAELKLLLRYANDSYQSMLEATTRLRTVIEAKEKPGRPA